MPYDLDHWDNPRSAIATKFKNNDMGYSTDGAIGAIKILKALNVSFDVAARSTILDYGCGTGRVARILSFLFKQVIAYDPNVECINKFKEENIQCGHGFHNIKITNKLSDIVKCDYGCAISVIEHLTDECANECIDVLQNNITDKLFINYSPIRNINVMSRLIKKEILDDQKDNIVSTVIDMRG